MLSGTPLAVVKTDGTCILSGPTLHWAPRHSALVPALPPSCGMTLAKVLQGAGPQFPPCIMRGLDWADGDWVITF